MSQQDLIAAIVKEVLSELNGGKASQPASTANGRSLHYQTDYPLSQKRRELVKTATGKSLDDITLDAIMSGAVQAEEIRITPQTLEYQAQIAESIKRPQLARNMRRAGELTRVPDDRVLAMYNALRPNRSSKAELLAIADELEKEYDAKVCANFVREAAGVYEARDVLKKD
ncbi:MAG: diol dehydratase small subunit [Chloroflexota bacterium]|nr:diol dehydratase small subunit [Anaerolineales bacterium]MCB8968248.1 diol dehydratase small subunit [Ardenticatenaceae bacterium]